MAISQTQRGKRIVHTFTFTVEGEADLPYGHDGKRSFRPAEMSITVINGEPGGQADVRGPRVLKAGPSEHEKLRAVFGDYNADSAPQWVRDALSACVADAAADQ